MTDFPKTPQADTNNSGGTHSATLIQTDHILDVAQLSARLGISEGHVRALPSDGKLPKPIKVGRKGYWRVADVEAYEEAEATKKARSLASAGNAGRAVENTALVQSAQVMALFHQIESNRNTLEVQHLEERRQLLRMIEDRDKRIEELQRQAQLLPQDKRRSWWDRLRGGGE